MNKDKFGYERIDDSPEFDGPTRESHEYRYKLAGTYTQDDDVVLDSACGTGYGKAFLKGNYIGVDRFSDKANIVADLHYWIPDFNYDVFISFETIEHLVSYQQLVDNAKKSRRIIAVSTPIVPTVIRDRYGNPDIRHYHVNDFTMDQFKNIFVDETWSIVHEEIQGGRYGILILQRNG